jgi:hypothetical protein
MLTNTSVKVYFKGFGYSQNRARVGYNLIIFIITMTSSIAEENKRKVQKCPTFNYKYPADGIIKGEIGRGEHSGKTLAPSSQGQGFESSRCCWHWERENGKK